MDVLELVPEAVILVSGAEDGGRMLYLNSQAGRMFGYSCAELVNQPFDVLLQRRSREPHLLGRRRDGTEFPVDVLLKPTEDGPACGIITIVHDRSDRNRLETALTEARDSAMRANEVKSRFLAAASHDLRQPLQTIWSLQAVLSRVHQNTEFAPHCALLEDALRSMDHMLSSLIDINRLENGAIQPVIRDFPLEDILPRLRSEFGYAASVKSLTLAIDESAECAISDPMLLPVILRNLIGNAIKYTQTGTVRVRVRADQARLLVDVIDSGPGIPSAHLSRLFEAFYQIDNPHRDQRQGVGLGLSIVQTLCRLLEHTVTIESQPGRGSTFTVQLPRGIIAARAREPDDIRRPMAGPSTRKATVLHIEDDPGVARSMAMLLHLEGYEVIGAVTRDDALQLVRAGGVRPDLILCDYRLPLGCTGDEVVTAINRCLGAKTPTIMLTGDISDKHIDRAKQAADLMMPKPVDANRLLNEMERLLTARPAT
jgi:signal transduction histidine kinase/ActR/RegA family two-component response regulator